MTDGKLIKEERLKQEKAGLDVYDDIIRYAKDGFDTIDAGDFMRFKWWGVYQQRPNVGHFMMRIKVNGGIISSDQLRAICGIAHDYGRDLLDVTTRQTLQLHWLQIQDFPDIFARLDAVGLTSAGACGDIARNITASPTTGIDPDEYVDTRPVADALFRYFLLNKEFGNLPRKYKIAVEGHPIQSTVPQINDAALIAHRRASDGVVGYHFFVGGGLSLQPHFAKALDIFVPADQIDKIVDVQRAITECYRDATKLRQKRTRARLKYLMADWGPEKFTEEVRAKLDWTPDPADPTLKLSDETYRDHIGIHAQKQPGKHWIGCCLLGGRSSAEQMTLAANIADEFGGGEIRFTNRQNILFPDISTENLQAAQDALQAAGFEWDVPNIRRGAVSCTGIEFCNLALTETKLRIKEVVAHLETVHPNPYERELTVHMNGCPNSCGQHHIGNIGMQGCLYRQPDGTQIEAFDIHLGGDLGENATFTRAIHRKVPANAVKYAVANVITKFKETRSGDERFAQWAHRHTNEELDAFLGVETIIGAPDAPTPRGADAVDA